MTQQQTYIMVHLGNFYLSSIQQGIQAHHACTEMFRKYIKDSKKSNKRAKMIWDWTKHPTVYLLNGGAQEDLFEHIDYFDNKENPYPWAFFREETGAINSALTSVAILVPEFIMRPKLVTDSDDWKESYQTGQVRGLSDYQVNLTLYLKQFPLAS